MLCVGICEFIVIGGVHRMNGSVEFELYSIIIMLDLKMIEGSCSNSLSNSYNLNNLPNTSTPLSKHT